MLRYVRNVRWQVRAAAMPAPALAACAERIRPPLQFADIVPDYILGNGTAALYISVRYHLLHPEYLFFRIRELQRRRGASGVACMRCAGADAQRARSFRLRLVLCHVDVEDVVKALGEINKTAAVHACSLVCAWSPEEVARYLETFKLYENKTAENIQERTENDYASRLTGALSEAQLCANTTPLTPHGLQAR